MKKILFITATIMMVFSLSAMACPTTGGGCGGDCGGQPCPECVGATEITAKLPSDLDHNYYYIWKVNLTIPQGQVITSAGFSIYGINDWQIEKDDVLYARYLDSTQVGSATSDMHFYSTGSYYRGTDNQTPGDALDGHGQSVLPNGWDVPYTDKNEYSKEVPYTEWDRKHHRWVLKTRTEWVNPPEDLCYDLTKYLKGKDPTVIGIGLDPDCHYDTKRIEFWYCTAPPSVPAPGAVLLGGIGVSIVGWLRRRRTL